MNIFGGPDYGAAQSHIAELMRERADYESASVAQAARIKVLESEVKALTDDLATAHEQLDVVGLISESRARQLEEERLAAEATAAQTTKLRSSVRLLWGLLQEMQTRLSEQQASVSAGSELLESLSDMLSEEAHAPA